ncbi:hypothetical protein ACQE3D_15630 [Methylomonas sp. MS20]|uniref:hypothetical protein n=1 Tax=unclassified Methylomonas TaxID=2608980 RepID=UPI0028A45EC9|nr:hypothetical protein [Methylomonas sp. MV1]MDT4331198.1 hypothetical protein [Methylomonas sp. MV1]
MEKITLYMDKFISLISNTWLIGALFKAGRKTYAEALYEFSYLICWSILPFALGTLTLYVTTDSGSEQKDLYEYGISTFKNGELLVFTISMLAPILYLINYDPNENRPFPHKLPISTVVTLIVVTSAALFALMKAHAVKENELVFTISVILTLIALIFRYLALVYHRLRTPPVNEMDLRSSEVSFVNQYRTHIENQKSNSEQTNFTTEFEKHLGNQQ